MINIRLNNQKINLAENKTLQELLVEQGLAEQQSFAIAINQNFIPRASYATQLLQDNDEVDIIIPMQGG